MTATTSSQATAVGGQPLGHYLTVERPAQPPYDAAPEWGLGETTVSARAGEPPVLVAAPARATKPSSATRPVLTDTRRVPRRGSPSCQTSELDSSAAVDVAALLDDLAPCCTATDGDAPCSRPAEWICWFQCPCGTTDRRGFLHCRRHYMKAINGQMVGGKNRHRSHGAAIVTRSEHLRSKPTQ